MAGPAQPGERPVKKAFAAVRQTYNRRIYEIGDDISHLHDEILRTQLDDGRATTTRAAALRGQTTQPDTPAPAEGSTDQGGTDQGDGAAGGDPESGPPATGDTPPPAA